MPERPTSEPRRLGWLGTASIAAAALWAVLRAGTGVMPDLPTFTEWSADWPSEPTEELHQVYLNSPLGQIAAQLLHASSPRSFLVLHTVATALAITGLALWAYAAASRDARSQAARLVILAPIAAILLAWIGYYDSFTVLCWVAVLFAWRTDSRWLLAASGMLLGFQHFEQSTVAVLSWFLVWLALRAQQPFTATPNPAWTFIGIVIGKVILLAALSGLNDANSGGRGSWLTDPAMLRTAVSTAINNGPLLLWSMFAGFWVVVIYVVLSLGPSRRKSLVLAVAAIALPMVMTLVTLDRPRVFVMTTIPIVLMLAVVFAERVRAMEPPQVRYTLEAVVWLGTPVIFWGQALFNFGALDRLIVLYGALS